MSAALQLAPTVFENTSGLQPLGHAVLVRTYEPEVQQGMIQIPEHVKRSMNIADQRCVVIAVGPSAWENESSARARPGDRVLVTQYAGYITNHTKDGYTYRLVNDRDIFCRIDFDQNEVVK